jgi:hypothetical protein
MPRYRMTESDLSALVAYMRGLGEVHDPGLTSDTIRIGTVLPLSGPQAALGHDIESVLRAYFDEINRQGGIYGRKLELVSAWLRMASSPWWEALAEVTTLRQRSSLPNRKFPMWDH